MLCLSGEAGYITEPFNRNYRPGWLAEALPHQSLYISPVNQSKYEPAIDRVVEMRYPGLGNLTRARDWHERGRVGRDWIRSLTYRVRRVRPLLKDPYAFFSAEWLARRFGMEVVVMIRHPAGFVSSIKKLGWKRDFRGWANQELLLRDHLGAYADQVHDYVKRTDEIDIVDRAILMWNCYYSVAATYRERHPEWVFLRYEDLAEHPVERFRAVYGRLGLTWSDRVEKRVREHSDPRNVQDVPASASPHIIKRDSRAARETWRARLSPHEVERVQKAVAAVAAPFYSNADWDSAEHP
jgi:Sulfotransferase family